MKISVAGRLAWLLSALLVGACSSGGVTSDKFNEPPVYAGPGCYDHRNRIERTITTPAECASVGWVWKT